MERKYSVFKCFLFLLSASFRQLKHFEISWGLPFSISMGSVERCGPLIISNFKQLLSTEHVQLFQKCYRALCQAFVCRVFFRIF